MPANSKDDDQDILIKITNEDEEYLIHKEDFEKVEKYCENECMGVTYLISANFLRKMVNKLLSADFVPPLQLKDFASDSSKKKLEESGLLDSIEEQFGTGDLEIVTRHIVKKTYNFLHKI